MPPVQQINRKVMNVDVTIPKETSVSLQVLHAWVKEAPANIYTSLNLHAAVTEIIDLWMNKVFIFCPPHLFIFLTQNSLYLSWFGLIANGPKSALGVKEKGPC